MLHQPTALSPARAARAAALRRAILSDLAADSRRGRAPAWLYAAVMVPRFAAGPRVLKIGVRSGRFNTRFRTKDYAGWKISEIGSAAGDHITIRQQEDALLAALAPFALDLGPDVPGGSECASYTTESLAVARPFFPDKWRPRP